MSFGIPVLEELGVHGRFGFQSFVQELEPKTAVNYWLLSLFLVGVVVVLVVLVFVVEELLAERSERVPKWFQNGPQMVPKVASAWSIPKAKR